MRASAHSGRGFRALSQSDAIPREDIEEITDRIELLTANPAEKAPLMSQDELSKIMASFESQLLEMNQTLSKETRNNRVTARHFIEECAKTKESVEGLNTELAVVVRRSVR